MTFLAGEAPAFWTQRFSCFLGIRPAGAADDRRNVHWTAIEDVSLLLGCYGDPGAENPNTDAFASKSHLDRTPRRTARCRGGLSLSRTHSSSGRSSWP